MSLTEEEAKKKWCPYARTMSVAHYGKEQMTTPAFNRIAMGTQEETITRNPIGCNCIASECMAWRWKTESKTKHDPNWGQHTTEFSKSTTHGYCGLAGSP